MIPGSGLPIKPSLPTPFPSGEKTWKCTATGLLVPQDAAANLEYRAKLLRKADKDRVLQNDLLAAARESLIFWVDTFAFTYHQFEIDPETGKSYPSKHPWHPFVLWPVQRDMMLALLNAFETGHDILISKSRDMGASWCCLAFLHWLWLTKADKQLREMSRIEDYVDSNSSKSLMWKHDALNQHLPEWMRPPDVMERGKGNRTLLRLHNELNGSTIGGESTNKYAMSGDRCAALLLDEFSKCEAGDKIRTATADVTPCRIVNSTPSGIGTAYSGWKNSGQITVFPLMFWDHPVKGKGRFVLQDDTTKEYSISSPWLENERKRRSQQEIAQEILACDLQIGDVFFDLNDLDKHAALYCRDPKERFNIKLRDKIPNADVARLFRTRDLKAVQLTRAKDGELAVWAPLTNGRLDQSKSYIIGMDISKGQGGEGTSETVASVKCKQTGEIVAKWASRVTPPYEAARVMAALCLWVGGGAPQRLPFAVWECNGPGWDMTAVFVKQMGYQYYYRDETIGVVATKTTDKVGWHSNRERKQLLLRAYERALKEDRIINRDKQSLDQARTYITYPNGGCGPAELVDKDKSEYLGHGDRVIADALCVLDKSVMNPKPESEVAPGESWGGRFSKWKKTQRRGNDWRQPYNFA